MKLPITDEQILISRFTAEAKILGASGCTPFDTTSSGVTFSNLASSSSGYFWAQNLNMQGMVGPQNDLSTEMYSPLNSLLKNCTNSWASASILGKSVCPPSQGRTMVSLWFLMVAGQSIELPNPVPGPMTPLILLGLGWTQLIGTKFSSGTSKIPYEAAQKSLMNLKCGIFRLVPSSSPDNVFHFSTLARETVLSKMGPAIPILATSGYCSTPARNFSMADWKTSQSATARVSFLRVARGVFLVVSTLTSQRRMLVPPTSPSNAYLSTSDISIKYLFYQSTSQLKVTVFGGIWK